MYIRLYSLLNIIYSEIEKLNLSNYKQVVRSVSYAKVIGLYIVLLPKNK